MSQSENRVLVSFDIDGTMEFGDPPGPISPSHVHDLLQRGFIVGCASDRAKSSQAGLWLRHNIELSFLGGKHQLMGIRERFLADRYVHVGDTDLDRRYALEAGFEFLFVQGGIAPVLP
jgi:hypothetical protein